MPTSTPLFDDQIAEWIKAHPYPAYTDIGPGEGKYGKMINEVLPGTIVTGIEVEARYVDLFHLTEIYRLIYTMRAIDYFKQYPESNWNVVILGDVIEHMWKSEGLDLLNFLIYRTRFMILTYPTAYKQGPWEGFIHEAHLSTWSDADFPWEHQHYRKIGDNNIEHNLVILRGFREI